MLKKNDITCRYCMEYPSGRISGVSIKTDEFKETAGYKRPFIQGADVNLIDWLELFILKGPTDKYAGLMVDSGNGARYVDIKYCPFCGRKIYDDKVMR